MNGPISFRLAGEASWNDRTKVCLAEELTPSPPAPNALIGNSSKPQGTRIELKEHNR
jgi:hypothetical protein